MVQLYFVGLNPEVSNTVVRNVATIVREYVVYVFLKIQKNATFYVFFAVAFKKNVKKRNPKIFSFQNTYNII